jgi:hypothetical protein
MGASYAEALGTDVFSDTKIVQVAVLRAPPTTELLTGQFILAMPFDQIKNHRW